ncbi:hypothetical protein GCM10018965_062050 [Nonomuraea roseola]
MARLPAELPLGLGVGQSTPFGHPYHCRFAGRQPGLPPETRIVWLYHPRRDSPAVCDIEGQAVVADRRR